MTVVKISDVPYVADGMDTFCGYMYNRTSGEEIECGCKSRTNPSTGRLRDVLVGRFVFLTDVKVFFVFDANRHG